MTGRADIVLAGRHKIFEADQCEISGHWVHAEGRWRTRTGANYATISYSEPCRYTWPHRSIAEVRWAA